MSKIAISPNVSGTGTFTIAAPDSNTDRTLTLPDAGGSVVLNEGSGTFKIDSSGNVGIGTSSPSDLINLSSSDPRIRLTNTGSGYCLVRTGGADASLILDADAGNTGAGSDIIMRIDGTERMRIDSAGNLAFNSGYGSTAVAYGCRAWVNFNGTGTVAIRGSGNVSSITDNGTGQYTVNFTTAMPDANYSAVMSAGPSSSGTGSGVIRTADYSTARTVSSFRLQTINFADSFADQPHINAAIFR